MSELPHYPAAFINAISEEGTKGEAVDWLQKTWNELQHLKAQRESRELALIRAALDRVVEYLEGSTFGEREIPTVRSCVALIRSLDPQTIRRGVKE